MKRTHFSEAMVFVGYDNTSVRYVVHWLDVFGGRFSETLGYGTRNGNPDINALPVRNRSDSDRTAQGTPILNIRTYHSA